MKYKYNEQLVLSKLKEYIDNTYSEHYVGGSGYQIQDMFKDLEIAEDFSRASAIKYLIRFGKKEGKNPKDLFKALHYTILLFHYSGLDKTLDSCYNDSELKISYDESSHKGNIK